MWIIILLVVFIIAVFLILRVGSSSTQQKSVIKQGQGASSGSSNYFKFEMPLSEHDSQYSTATFDDENVYFNWRYVGEEVIGSFKRRTSGKAGYVFLDKEGREIGCVDDDYPNYILISRLAIYDNFLKMYGPEGKQEGEYFMKARYPFPAIDLVGKIFDSGGRGFIYDAKTDELIGRYTGSKIGAACAFCALTAEIHDDTEYAKFLVNWEKTEIKRISPYRVSFY